MNDKRAPWYRVEVVASGAPIDVTLSSEDEAQLMACLYELCVPVQIWAMRWSGAVDAMMVDPRHGSVRTSSRVALPIPILNGRPAVPGGQVERVVSPEDTEYRNIALPATIKRAPYVDGLEEIASDVSAIRLLIATSKNEDKP